MNPMVATLPPQAVGGLFGSKRRKPVPPIAAGGNAPGRLFGSQPQAAQAMPGEAPVADGKILAKEIDAGRVPEMPQPAEGPLGGSMRQRFDYDAAMKALAGEQKQPKVWQYALAALSDALARNSGSEPFAVQNLVGQRNAQAQRQFEAARQILAWQQGDYAAQRDADLQAANPFTIGRERLGYNPATGETDVLYRGRQDAEIYADSLGFDRDSEEWGAAVEDFVLRGSGPSAHGRDLELDDHRTANDRGLEGYRQGNRVALERVRQGGRSSLEDQRQDNRMTIRQTPPARASAMPVVSSPDEARRLPPGTQFRVKGSNRVLRTPGG